MQLNALRRLLAQSEAGPIAADARRQAQQLSAMDLGVFGLGLGVKASCRQTITASNVYDALNQSTRNMIKSISESERS